MQRWSLALVLVDMGKYLGMMARVGIVANK
jgi:hypothetical protein